MAVRRLTVGILGDSDGTLRAALDETPEEGRKQIDLISLAGQATAPCDAYIGPHCYRSLPCLAKHTIKVLEELRLEIQRKEKHVTSTKQNKSGS